MKGFHLVAIGVVLGAAVVSPLLLIRSPKPVDEVHARHAIKLPPRAYPRMKSDSPPPPSWKEYYTARERAEEPSTCPRPSFDRRIFWRELAADYRKTIDPPEGEKKLDSPNNLRALHDRYVILDSMRIADEMRLPIEVPSMQEPQTPAPVPAGDDDAS